jgi:hypothetical protein
MLPYINLQDSKSQEAKVFIWVQTTTQFIGEQISLLAVEQ